MPAISAPRGTNDLLPAQASAWEWLHATHAAEAGSFGYRLADSPIFEATELFERGVQGGTDVVDKEMYTFEDRGGRSLTLRPEGTAGILRAVLSAHLDQETRPVRVHYRGPMFRYDRPQKGRYRQFSTLGIECVGEQSPYLDAEVVELGWRYFAALGITGVSLQINSLGDPEDRERYRDALRAYYEPLRDQLCEDCQRRLEINPLRLLDCKRDAGFVQAAPTMSDTLSAASKAHFDTVLEVLNGAQIPYEINPRLVRGLDYYTHTAFEYWHTSLQGAQNALGGGGRYDGLAEAIGYPATPGVGYGLGVERIWSVAQESGLVPAESPVCDVLVLSVEAQQAPAALELARLLRNGGIATVADVAERKLDKKLRQADKLGAQLAVIVGESEVADGTATLRDLRDRSQRSVAHAELVGHANAALKEHV